MSFRRRVKYFLVHTLQYTNKDADKLIASGALSINGKIIVQNEFLDDKDELAMGEKVIRGKPGFEYYALHKPAGIESTFKKDIEDNLSKIFPFDDSFFIAGRLDKASEGLLLISNDGKWISELTRADRFKEKEYIVEIDKDVSEDFVRKMSTGVDIKIAVTRPCKVTKCGYNSFNIILTEGKNKQIRRMCKSLGCQVLSLRRIRIDKFHLTDIQKCKYRVVEI